MPFELPDLPYALDALAPHLSRETLELHYGKHHRAYVTKLNDLLNGTTEENKTLQEIITGSDGVLFNQAAQHWNHTFYWHCMTPNGGGDPTGPIADTIGTSFGTYDAFRKELTDAAMSQFGSGWAWLTDDGNGRLTIATTANADLPLAHDAKALLTIDIWEHAYYVDYRNRRGDYIDTFFDHLINWDFVNDNLG